MCAVLHVCTCISNVNITAVISTLSIIQAFGTMLMLFTSTDQRISQKLHVEMQNMLTTVVHKRSDAVIIVEVIVLEMTPMLHWVQGSETTVTALSVSKQKSK